MYLHLLAKLIQFYVPSPKLGHWTFRYCWRLDGEKKEGFLKEKANLEEVQKDNSLFFLYFNNQSHIRKRLPSGNQGALNSSYSNLYYYYVIKKIHYLIYIFSLTNVETHLWLSKFCPIPYRAPLFCSRSPFKRRRFALDLHNFSILGRTLRDKSFYG